MPTRNLWENINISGFWSNARYSAGAFYLHVETFQNVLHQLFGENLSINRLVICANHRFQTLINVSLVHIRCRKEFMRYSTCCRCRRKFGDDYARHGTFWSQLSHSLKIQPTEMTSFSIQCPLLMTCLFMLMFAAVVTSETVSSG